MVVQALRQAGVLGGNEVGGNVMGGGRSVDVCVSAGVSVVGCRNVVGGGGKAREDHVEVEGGRKRKADEVSGPGCAHRGGNNDAD